MFFSGHGVYNHLAVRNGLVAIRGANMPLTDGVFPSRGDDSPCLTQCYMEATRGSLLGISFRLTVLAGPRRECASERRRDCATKTVVTITGRHRL